MAKTPRTARTPRRPIAAPLALWASLAVTATLVAGGLAAGTDDAALALSRVGMDVAGVAVVGLALLGVLVPAGHKHAAGVLAQADRAIAVAAAGWLMSVVVVIVHRVADAAGRPLTEVGAAELITWATTLSAGQGLVLTAAATTLVFVVVLVRMRRPELVPARLVVSASAFALITPAVTGHAAATDSFQVISVIGVGVHVAAAAGWVGGLGAVLLLVAPHRGLLVAVLPRFSRLATACIAGVTATGMLTAAIHLAAAHGGSAGWAALPDSGWGRLLLAKVVALTAIGALGWITRRRMAASRTPLLRWAGYEVALMAVAMGLAAALTQAPTHVLP